MEWTKNITRACAVSEVFSKCAVGNKLRFSYGTTQFKSALVTAKSVTWSSQNERRIGSRQKKPVNC